jgi:hypothetical protein
VLQAERGAAGTGGLIFEVEILTIARRTVMP